MSKDKESKKCSFCGNDIRPLDRHAHSVSPDKDAAENQQLMVTCILNRYYKVKNDGET